MCAYNSTTTQANKKSVLPRESNTDSSPEDTTVYVRGPWHHLTSSTLTSHFSRFGEIHSLSFPTDPSHPLALSFANPDALHRVLADPTHTVDTLSLFCSEFPSVDDLLQAHPSLLSLCLYVEGLPPHVSETHVLKRFGRFGTILAITLHRDPSSHCLPACSLLFSHARNADYLLETRRKFSHRIFNYKLFIYPLRDKLGLPSFSSQKKSSSPQLVGGSTTQCAPHMPARRLPTPPETNSVPTSCPLRFNSSHGIRSSVLTSVVETQENSGCPTTNPASIGMNDLGCSAPLVERCRSEQIEDDGDREWLVNQHTTSYPNSTSHELRRQRDRKPNTSILVSVQNTLSMCLVSATSPDLLNHMNNVSNYRFNLSVRSKLVQ